jgi:hypothetical protein
MCATDWIPSPQTFDVETALEIRDRAQLLLADMIPGCTARRYDFPPEPDYHWGVELCFVDHGPISPQLWLSCDKYYSRLCVDFHYISMLKDASDHGVAFNYEVIPSYARLDAGAEAIAVALYEAIGKVDLAKMIAAGTIERIFADYRSPAPWPCFYLAQCAIYLGHYDEARALLQDSLKYAEEDGRPNYRGLSAVAETYLKKLKADPDALRAELNATVDYNWSHLKVVGG